MLIDDFVYLLDVHVAILYTNFIPNDTVYPSIHCSDTYSQQYSRIPDNLQSYTYNYSEPVPPPFAGLYMIQW